MFDADGVYESPVGSGWKVGPAAIAADCEAWNSLIGPQGNGVSAARAAKGGECARNLTQRPPPRLPAAAVVPGRALFERARQPHVLYAADPHRQQGRVQDGACARASRARTCALTHSRTRACVLTSIRTRSFSTLPAQDIHGIVTVEFDTATQLLLRWFHYYVRRHLRINAQRCAQHPHPLVCLRPSPTRARARTRTRRTLYGTRATSTARAREGASAGVG